MRDIDFLADLGWPASRLGEYGTATWSAGSADGLSIVKASLARDAQGIRASVDHVGLEGGSSLMHLRAEIDSGAVAKVLAANIGEPPEPVDAEEAIHLFKHMSQGMGAPRFDSIGPIALPAAKPAAKL